MTPTEHSNLIPAARECGACDVCCTAMRVSALNKPAGTQCVHMRETGCGNYQDRPAACRNWYCMWLRDTKGILSEAERPDRLGLFLTASKPIGPHGMQVIFAHPVRRDAMDKPAARGLVKRLRQFAPVQVLPFQGNSAPLTHEGRAVAIASSSAKSLGVAGESIL